MDYTVGVATKDRARQDKAVADLIGDTEDFGAFAQRTAMAHMKTLADPLAEATVKAALRPARREGS